MPRYPDRLEPSPLHHGRRRCALAATITLLTAGCVGSTEAENQAPFTAAGDRLGGGSSAGLRRGSQPGPCEGVSRIAGANRFATAAAIADAAELDRGTVLLARSAGGGLIDALSAGPLAHRMGAPVLLTTVDAVPAETLDALRRWGTNAVILIGGEVTISPAVEAQLRALPTVGSVSRIAGPNRFGTAAEVASRFGTSDLAFISSGADSAVGDALAAASAAAQLGVPLLLVTEVGVPVETAEAIAELGVTRVFVVGDERAVPQAVLEELPNARRLGGANLRATAAAVAVELAAFEDLATSTVLVSGDAPVVDALAGAALGAPVLYSGPAGFATESVAAFRALRPANVVLLGGEAALSGGVADGACAALGSGFRGGFEPDDCDAWLSVGDDFQAIIDRHPAGTVYCVRRGVHRHAQIRPKDGDRFVGESGAILSGARDVSADHAEWRAAGEGVFCLGRQTQEAAGRYDRAGQLEEGGNPRDVYPEDLWVDDVRYRHASSLSALRPGWWHLDYDADRLCIAEDPAGLGRIEAAITPWALSGHQVRDVVVENLIFEKFANGWRTGVIGGWFHEPGYDWVIRDVTVRRSHALGIAIGPGMLIEGCEIYELGHMAMGGETRDVIYAPEEERPVTIRSSSWHHNRTLDYAWGHEGVFKLSECDGCVVENNHVHHNYGPGIWYDIDNVNSRIIGNLVEYNDAFGIFYEISYAGEIAFNTVRGNGPLPRQGGRGYAIFISSSKDVDIHHNLLFDNHDEIGVLAGNRGSSPSDGIVYEPTGLRVHDNQIRLTAGLLGLSVEDGAAAPEAYRSAPYRGITFSRNHYLMTSADDVRFRWPGPTGETATTDFAGWRSRGFDVDGTLRVVDADAPVRPAVDGPYFQRRRYGAR